MHLVDDRDGARHRVEDAARRARSRRPGIRRGCGTAGRPASTARGAAGPRARRTGAARPGADPANSRSHASEPIDGDERQMLAAGRGTRLRAPAPRCRPARRAPSARRRRRSWRPERWRPASAASESVAARLRAPSDPSVKSSRHGGKMGTCPRAAQGLCEFIDASPSPFHVCETVAQRLRDAGFTELAEADAWPAARRPASSPCGPVRWWPGRPATTRATPFRIVGGHTDSPNLRVKQHPDRSVAGWRVVALRALRRGVAELVAGPRPRDQRAAVGPRRRPASSHRLVRIDDPILRVPQLAIHLAEDRAAVKLDPQRHVNAVWGVGGALARSSTTSPSGPAWTPPTCWAST